MALLTRNVCSLMVWLAVIESHSALYTADHDLDRSVAELLRIATDSQQLLFPVKTLGQRREIERLLVGRHYALQCAVRTDF